MFNIGAGEMVFILVAALLILGPQRLPELARAIGKFMREFRRQTDEVRNVVEREFYSMDQELQREPPRRPTATPAPPLAPYEVPPLASLPAPSEQPDPGPGASGSEPTASEPAASAPTASEPAVPEPAESVADAAPETEGLPKLAPLPGTVARNAPKQG